MPDLNTLIIKRSILGVIALCVIVTGYFALRPTLHRSGDASSHPENKSSRDEIRSTQSVAERSSTKARMASPLPPTVPLKVQYASPPPHIAQERPLPTPVRGQAVIDVGGKTFAPKNNAGHYERIAAKLNQPIPVRLSWPDDNSHAGVFVQAVHGGKIDNGRNSKGIAFDADKSISFTFTPDSGPGTYEIVLRRGTTEEALQFWVPTGNPKADKPTLR